jgi:1-acyl-sn-glycerol-3-phosphate acyltransferase
MKGVKLQGAPGGDASTQLPQKHPLPHHIARFLLRPLFRVYFGMRAEGLEHLPYTGAYIMAPNHVSMLDWAFISYFLPR